MAALAVQSFLYGTQPLQCSLMGNPKRRQQ